MSSRALRRLRGNRVFDIAEQLGLDQSTDEEEEEEEEDYESDHAIQPDINDTKPHQNESLTPQQTNDESQKRKIKNKKKNKKKKQKKKAQQIAKAKNNKKSANKKQNKNYGFSNKQKYTKNKPKQNKSTSIQSIKEEKKENDPLQTSDEICSNWTLLNRDPRYFDPNFEMKRKYGSIALEANDESNINPSNKHKNTKQQRIIKAKQHQLQKKYGHLAKRKISLIKFNAAKWPKPYLHFAKRTGNIYMELMREDHTFGTKHFEFKYDNDYNGVQMEYKQRCAQFDPQQISFLIQQHPYHVDTCLTMSDIMSKHGQLEEAADMVERGLYRLENGLHSRFSWITSDCRLDYNIVTNRCFLLCLWKYLNNLGRRGCVHTAFELTKCLLSLSPIKDPLCSLLCLDYWALRSNEYQWILDFAESFKINIFNQEMDSLRMYPNWCYSVAFAKYQMELQQSFQQKQYSFGECDNQRIPMDLTVINGLSASVLMQQSILMFPEVIGPLLSKANERILAQNQWKDIMENEYYLRAKLRRNEIGSIRKLCNIYAERAHALWNNDDLLKWVWKHCRFILERLKNPLSFRIKENMNNNDEENKDNDVEDDELVEFEDLSVFDGIRDAVYDNKNENKFQMLDINDFSDVITTLPIQELPDALMRPQTISLDELQNLNGEELNRVLDQLLAAGIQIPHEIQQRLNQGQNIQNQNVLHAMLYSMMPWVNPIINPRNNDNQQNDNNNDGNDDQQ